MTTSKRYHLHGIYTGCSADHGDEDTCRACADGIYCTSCGDEQLDGQGRVVASEKRVGAGEREHLHVCLPCAPDFFGWPRGVDAEAYALALIELRDRRRRRVYAWNLRCRNAEMAEQYATWRARDYARLRDAVAKLRELRADAACRAAAIDGSFASFELAREVA